MRDSRSSWGLFFFTVCVMVSPPGVTAALGPQAHRSESIEIDVNTGLLTLVARDVALVEVVKAIGERAGFETVVAGPIAQRVTSSMSGVPVPEALQRLLAGIDHVVLYRTTSSQGSIRKIEQLWLLGASAAPSRAPLRAAVEEPADAPPMDAAAKARSEDLLRLTRKGATQAVLDTLVDALRRDPAPLVRVRAAMALGTLGDARALPALEIALDDEHESVQRQVIVALSQIHDEAATRILGDVLLHAGSTRPRVLAARGLWRHDTLTARAYLDSASNDPDEQVRDAATRVPGELTADPTRPEEQDALGSPYR